MTIISSNLWNKKYIENFKQFFSLSLKHNIIKNWTEYLFVAIIIELLVCVQGKLVSICYFDEDNISNNKITMNIIFFYLAMYVKEPYAPKKLIIDDNNHQKKKKVLNY